MVAEAACMMLSPAIVTSRSVRLDMVGRWLIHCGVKAVVPNLSTRRCCSEQTVPLRTEENCLVLPDTSRYSRNGVWTFREARIDVLSRIIDVSGALDPPVPNEREKCFNLGPNRGATFHNVWSPEDKASRC